MFTRINLSLQRFPSLELRERGIFVDFIRLLGRVEFETEAGWSKPHLTILDTGAPMCLLPLDRWQECRIELLAEDYPLRGVVPKKECTLPVKVGKVALRLVDEKHVGKRLEVEAYLAPTNEVPLVIGFHSCLERFKVVFDCERRFAYVEER
jgi:hypothetical protein